MVKVDGVELIKVDMREIKGKKVKEFGEKVGHYWFLEEGSVVVIAEPPPRLGLMNMYFVQSERVVKGPKLLIDVSPSITNQWTSTPYESRDLCASQAQDPPPHIIHVHSIYAQTHMVHLHCLKGFASLFTIDTSDVYPCTELIRVTPGAYVLSVLDNVLVFHNVTEQTSYLWDVKGKEGYSGVVWHGIAQPGGNVSFRVYIDRSKTDYFPELQLKYDGKVIPSLSSFTCALDLCTSLNLIECPWFLPTQPKINEGVFLDTENSRVNSIHLNWKEIARNWRNKRECVGFLLRRKDVSKEEVINYCLELICDRIEIQQIAGVFAALVTEKDCQMSQNDLHTFLFRRIFLVSTLDFSYISSSLFCFFHTLTALDISINPNIQFAFAQFLLRTGQIPLFHQSLSCLIFDDTQELALMMTLSTRHSVFVAGLDMLYRLEMHEELFQLMWERKRFGEFVWLMERWRPEDKIWKEVCREMGTISEDFTEKKEESVDL